MKHTHSLCESVHASGRSPWHIRENAGPLKLGGGIDTNSLCGLVRAGWDLAGHVETYVTKTTSQSFMCSACVDAYQAAQPSSGGET